MGYAGYDMVRYCEDLPNAPEDDRRLPDLMFGLYDTMVLFDHVSKTIKVVGLAHVGKHGVDRAYEGACRRIKETVEALSQTGWSITILIRVRRFPGLPEGSDSPSGRLLLLKSSQSSYPLKRASASRVPEWGEP